jgi:N6-L-threonylcarbamoyladenine synthase
MKILAIDTACDETSVAVIENTTVLSNIVWSQASLHARWGGIVPSLAQREHAKRINWVIDRALFVSGCQIEDLAAIAVTIGPCLAIAGEVGIQKAKELATKYKKALIAINHIEGHLLGPLLIPKKTKSEIHIQFPSLGLVISGGHTDLILIEKIGKYKLIARTRDDALGEALDKAARMLGLGYPGGAILERFAREGNKNYYPLPIPMLGREKEMIFSYSGLKTAMWKEVEKEKTKNHGSLSKPQIQNLAASFQDKAFEHLTRVISYAIRKNSYNTKYLLIGGGVSANNEVRKRLRKLAKISRIKAVFPYNKKLCGDNAAMIAVAGYYKSQRKEFVKDIKTIERIPRLSIDQTKL